ncbi:MAG: Rieske (2Fe-2S) protein [Planctomycetes bacterium]|nr:Rieske (2Fe-2S) protein [Planctomycetota bacterium]
MDAPSSLKMKLRHGRRAFLGKVAQGVDACLAAALGGCLLSGCRVIPRSFQAPAGDTVKITLKNYPELNRPGGIVKVLVPVFRVIYVRRNGRKDSFDGISGVCTHQGGIVSPSGSGFRCPLHGSTYDGEGQNTGGPAPRPLKFFRVTAEGDDVILHLKEKIG